VRLRLGAYPMLGLTVFGVASFVRTPKPREAGQVAAAPAAVDPVNQAEALGRAQDRDACRTTQSITITRRAMRSVESRPSDTPV
jgi:hypothetical protein